MKKSENTVATEPKKRGRKPKSESTATTDSKLVETQEDPVKVEKNSGWSDQRRLNIDTCKSYMYIEIELMRDALGMMPTSERILRDFIDSKEPNAPSVADEIAVRGAEYVEDDSTTVWPIAKFVRDNEKDILIDKYDVETSQDIMMLPDDDEMVIEAPFLYDYQMRGLFKDACGLLSRSKNNESANLKAYKKVIDGGIFVFPRHIAFELPESYRNEFGVTIQTYDKFGRLNRLQRTMRVQTPQGERNCLSSSEVLPAGSRMKFKIGMTSPSYRKVISEWLDYGLIRGIGQWRNSGIGIFRWRELDENWQPL